MFRNKKNYPPFLPLLIGGGGRGGDIMMFRNKRNWLQTSSRRVLFYLGIKRLEKR